MILLLALALQDLDGLWRGTLEVQGVPLRLNVRFAKDVGTVDSVDQGDFGRAIDGLRLQDRAVRFEVKSIGGVYEGLLEGDEIKGTWRQGGLSFPLTLKRSDQPFVLNRPQEPKRPFPYEEEEVEFRSGAHTLAGTLTRPKGPGPFPAVLLISGSGPQDRDETILGHKPFLVLSDFLTRRGVAVLRVDDRGVGKSTGDFSTATTLDFAEDARAGVGFLRRRKDVAKVGLIGHSEGGLIAPLAAKEVDFIVLLAGPGLPGDEVLLLQTAALSRAAGATEAQIALARPLNAQVYRLAKTVEDPQVLEKKLRELPLPPAQREALLTPWFRFFLRHDPRPVLKEVRCPVLALIGGKDAQVTPKENLAALREALKDHPDAEVLELPGLNHLFQACVTGGVAEYGRIEETLNPDALRRIGAWIEKRAK